MSSTIDICRDMAINRGLTFVHEQATHERGERFTINYGRARLFGSDTIAPVEYYLMGFRDGSTLPVHEAHQAMESLRITRNDIHTIYNMVNELLTCIDEVLDFIEPFTRERS